MPKKIMSKRENLNIQMTPKAYICPNDKTAVRNIPERQIFNYNQQQAENEKIKIVKSTKQSSNARCNRAVKLAEKEWDPKKEYEINGENRGPDIIRYRYGVDEDWAWCASFFNYLYNPNHVEGQNVFGMSDKDVISTQKILQKAKENDCFAASDSGYIPQVGDALIWRNDNDNKKGHIGIIVEVREDGSFVTIQGNNADKVEKIEYDSVSDAMSRTSSSGYNQTLQGFVQMSKYNEQHDLSEVVTDENDSLINPDSDYCWVT